MSHVRKIYIRYSSFWIYDTPRAVAVLKLHIRILPRERVQKKNYHIHDKTYPHHLAVRIIITSRTTRIIILTTSGLRAFRCPHGRGTAYIIMYA